MKIPPLDPGRIAARQDLPAQSDDATQHWAWRRALEQAQWEARLRYESAPQAAGLPGEPAGVAQWAATMQLPSVVQHGMEQAAMPAQAAMRVPGAEVGGHATAAPASRPVPPQVAGAPAGVATWLRLPVDEAVARAAASRALSSVCGERAQWQPTALVVNVQGTQVRVTLRDADLDSAHGARLERELRAQLAAQGLQLVELIVNGQPVPVEPALLSTTIGRQHGS